MPKDSKPRGRGRPPKTDAGNYERVYTCLRLDVSQYARRVAREERRSVSAVVAEFVMYGAAMHADRTRRRSKEA